MTPDEAYREAQRRIASVKKSETIAFDLSDLGLANIPREIGQFANLRLLDLSGNGLIVFPEELTQLSELVQLDLSRNQLTALPEELIQLASLMTLSLQKNRLKALLPELGQLANLTHLGPVTQCVDDGGLVTIGGFLRSLCI